MAEFQYNNHVHLSTQRPRFMLESGRTTRMGFEPQQPASRLETVNEFKDRMQESLKEAKAALTKAKDDMVQYYNRRRTPPPEYQISDKVYLNASDIKTTRPSQKLSHRYLGPFKIIGKPGLHTYKLELPLGMRRIHPVFNVVKLLHAPPDPIPGRKTDPPPPPELVDGEEHYEIEKVLDSRLFRNRLEYLVKWKGYGYEENSWVAERDMAAKDLVSQFHLRHPNAPRRIRTNAFNSLDFRQVRQVHHTSRTPYARGGVMSGDDHKFPPGIIFNNNNHQETFPPGNRQPSFPLGCPNHHVRRLLWPESGRLGWRQWVPHGREPRGF